MRRSKFDKFEKRFPFLNQIVESISNFNFNSDEIINNLDVIRVQQVGQKLLSRILINNSLFEIEDDGLIEVDYYDRESLFVVQNQEVVEHDSSFPIAYFFRNLKPDYLVLIRREDYEWNNYYDRIGGKEIDRLEITIFLVNEDFPGVCQRTMNRFYDETSF